MVVEIALIVPIAALIVSLATLISMAIAIRQKADEAGVKILTLSYDQLRRQLDIAQIQLADCERGRDETNRQMIGLLARISELERNRRGD